MRLERVMRQLCQVRPAIHRLAGRPQPRRGYSYIAVLGTSLIVSTLALGGMALLRIEARTALDSLQAVQARQHAKSAAELAARILRADPQWRTVFNGGHVFTPRAIGSGWISAIMTDPVDGILGNQPHDPVQMDITAVQGRAQQRFVLQLRARPEPLPILQYGVHTWGNVNIRLGASLSSYGGAVSTSGTLQNRGTIDGDVSATGIGIPGIITGNITLPGPIHDLPTEQVAIKYSELGTLCTAAVSTIDRQVITPTRNPYGPLNADGVYVIRPTGNLTISNTRLHGTLVVRFNSNNAVLTIGENVLFQPARPGYPVLVVLGNLELNYRSEGERLSEALLGTNFNPPDAPFLGVSNGTQTDEYPSEIQGLIYVSRRTTWRRNGLLRGALISEGPSGMVGIDVFGHPRVMYDRQLFFDPAPWLTSRVDMIPDRSSWKQIVQ